MNFELLDSYLLHGTPAKGDLIAALLKAGPPVPAAAPNYEGLRMLGPRTPDLALIALRLVLAGKTADDASVTQLRQLSECARTGGPEGQAAVEAFRQALSEG